MVHKTKQQILTNAGYTPVMGRPRKIEDPIHASLFIGRELWNSLPRKNRQDWIRSAITEKLERERKVGL